MKEKRIYEMADFIRKNKTVSLQELSDYFNVSIYTIRRDISELLDKNIVVKHYGGVSINKSTETLINFENRNTINKNSKQNIAKMSARYIEDNDILFIDSGTTTMYLADYLHDKKNITVITNNVYIINKCANLTDVKLIVLGGELDKRTYSLAGYQALDYLKRLNLTKCFLACTGISLENGLTNYTAIESDIKRICIENSKQVFLLVDSSKFDKTSLITFGQIHEVNYLITDKKPHEKYYGYFKKHGVNLIYD